MGIEQKQSKAMASIQRSKWAKWAPIVVLVLGLLILLLMAKGIAVLAADRIVYSIPILGGIARSLELAEFLNLLLFSVLGMGIGLGVHLIPVPDQERVGRSVLMVLIPILFLSGCFFQYQLWLSDVRAEMGISAAQVRAVTNQWLGQTVKKPGLWGFYHYTTLYSILPTNPDRLRASIQGSDRVNQLFSQVFSTTPTQAGQLLGLCVWGLRAFYFGLSVLTSLHHFEEGMAQGKHRLQSPGTAVPDPSKRKGVPRKVHKKVKSKRLND